MGGYRCSFRDCKVSSRTHPQMQFFHFPIKDEIRFYKWIEMAKAEYLLHLPMSQQANRVVCALHFYDNQFVNYRKDRLTKRAVPTITRLTRYVAYDFRNINQYGEPTLVRLQKPHERHLIPPRGFRCPLGFDEDDEIEIFDENESKSRCKNRLIFPCSNRRKLRLKERPNYCGQGNYKTQMQLQERTNNENYEAASVSKRRRKMSYLDEDDESNSTETLSIDRVSEEHEAMKEMKWQLSLANERIETLETIRADLINENNALKANRKFVQGKCLNMAIQHTQSLEEVARLTLENNELESKCANLELKISTSKTAAMTKNQLYECIKQYLPNSLATILRMGLLSSVDRNWHADERQLAMEVLGLGEGVYRYMTDIWNIRLPPMREIRSWVDESLLSVDEDDSEIESIETRLTDQNGEQLMSIKFNLNRNEEHDIHQEMEESESGFMLSSTPYKVI